MTLDKKEINPRIARWALKIQNFDYEVEHRGGNKMQHVYAFSRAVETLVIEDNPFEANLVLSQNRDPKLQQLNKELEKIENRFF